MSPEPEKNEGMTGPYTEGPVPLRLTSYGWKPARTSCWCTIHVLLHGSREPQAQGPAPLALVAIGALATGYMSTFCYVGRTTATH